MVSMKKMGEEISDLRNRDLNKAIERCEYATRKFPDENFFYKILGDMYYEQGEILKALECYTTFLTKIEEKPYLLNNFFRFINKIISNDNKEIKEEIKYRLLKLIADNEVNFKYKDKISNYMRMKFQFANQEINRLIGGMKNNQGNKLKKFLDSGPNEKIYIFYFILLEELEKRNLELTMPLYKIIVASMEKNKLYTLAILLSRHVLNNPKNRDSVAIRTLFRLCRYIGDYTEAEIYYKKNPGNFMEPDFNIQYELVYYFKYKEDVDRLKEILNKMKHSSSNSLPISKTLYNFYMQFEMFDEANSMITHMERLKSERFEKMKTEPQKGEDAAVETEEGVWDKLRSMVSEQEHNRQLAATRDLIKGFAHELGQPLTNIRYDIDFFRMKRNRNLVKPEDTDIILDNVLTQIVRIDRLMKRFSPIFSSRSEELRFDLKKETEDVFGEMRSRLEKNQVSYEIIAEEVRLFGDPLKYHQILYNLIINSIHAINESGKKGKIECKIEKKGKIAVLMFSDNGKGIPKELAKKIFEPFFTTKKIKRDKTKDEGGEGLGLYIVWNLLKFLNGKIKVDVNWKQGACFIIEFKLEEER